MLVATGSANCVQIGIVAATHSERLNSRGVVVSSEMYVASLEPQLRDANAWSRAARCAGAGDWLVRAANALPCCNARSQLMPSLLFCRALCNWVISCAIISGSFGRPAAPANCDGSICEFPDRNSRNRSRNSSSGSLSESSGMAPTLIVCEAYGEPFDLGWRPVTVRLWRTSSSKGRRWFSSPTTACGGGHPAPAKGG